jgi:hypothetical protein
MTARHSSIRFRASRLDFREQSRGVVTHRVQSLTQALTNLAKRPHHELLGQDVLLEPGDDGRVNERDTRNARRRRAERRFLLPLGMPRA